MKKLISGGSKGSYIPSADLKGLGTSMPKKPAVPPVKKKGSLASALAKFK